MAQRITSGKGAYGLIKAKYVRNISKKSGKRVTGNVQRLAYYNVYGNRRTNPEMQPRGPIYDQNGVGQKYSEYKAWALGKAQESAYTYRMIISPKGKILTDDDFVKSIQTAARETGLGSDFRVVIHRDTKHAHAHLMFQADKTINKKELENWKIEVRTGMIEREEARAKALGIKPPRVGEEEDSAENIPATKKAVVKNRGGKSVTDSDEPISKQPRRRRRRRSRSINNERSHGLG